LGKGWEKTTFYLHYLATHPDHQGRGIGSALVRHITSEVIPRYFVNRTNVEADRKGCRCFLEASKFYPNVPIYEHLGFKLVHTIEMTDGEDSVKVIISERTLGVNV
jgi:GNAT superfamily N-acetyltransferase